MFFRLLLLFTVVPVTELYLLITLGRYIGPLPTVGLVLFTGALGAWLAKTQGAQTWARVQNELRSGRLPATELVEALLILVAGAVLLTPGLITDVCGFLLLIPTTRGWLRRQLADRWRDKLAQAQGQGRVIVVENPRDR